MSEQTSPRVLSEMTEEERRQVQAGLVPPDGPQDAARDEETLGIDNTDTALSPEDESTPVE